LIAILATGVILTVVVVIAVTMFRSPPAGTNNGSVEQLRGVYFINPVAQANFDEGAEPGAEWKLMGEVPLRVSKGHGLGPAATQPSTTAPATRGGEGREYRAGAIVLAESIPPDEARMIDATLKATRATDSLVAEVFVAEGSPDEGTNGGGGGREMVWQLKGGMARVGLADGKLPVQGEKIDPRKTPSVNVKVRFNRDAVIVESGDGKLYEGPHKLGEASPRYVGVRFRRKAGEQTEGVWVTGLNVMKP
jgi:hypothetical protein